MQSGSEATVEKGVSASALTSASAASQHAFGVGGVEKNKRTATEFILFIRNKLYYNLKFRLSNILYKIEKFIPVFKSHTLLNNIYLLVTI